MTKQERLQHYREFYPEYVITGVKKMTPEEVKSRYHYGKESLYDLYVNPSNAKEASYKWIEDTYNPVKQALVGNSMTYSVLLETPRGITMLITKDNNYIVERS